MKFRLQALARLGEPEELDILPRLVDPRAWAAVLLLLLAVSGAVVWSFTARLTRTVTAPGVLAPAGALQAVQTPYAGVISSLSASAGSAVEVGTPIARVLTVDRRDLVVTSTFAGRLVTVSVEKGQAVQAGATVATVTGGGSAVVAKLFVPTAKAGQIGPGMTVLMSAESAPSAAFGLLRGRVAAIGPSVLTQGQASALIDNDALIAKLTSSGPTRLVTIDLFTDPKAPTGYKWTSAKGPPGRLPLQTLVSATVQVSSDHPISFVFGQ